MSMKKIFKKFGILLIFLVSACDLNGDLENPNQVPVSGADVNLVMNSVQGAFGSFMQGVGATVDPLVRQNAMSGGFRYQTAYQPQGVDGLWFTAYQGIIVNAEALIPIAAEKKLTTHVAVAKLLIAYTYLTMVDVFGDIPRTEAINGAKGNFNPVADSGSDVYAYAIGLIAEAKVELAKTGAEVSAGLARDIYYSGDKTKWTALANTLELKAWINLSTLPARATEAKAKIATFIDANGVALQNIIDTPSEDFTYKFGTATVPAGSRHPLYDQYYGPTKGSAGGYIANYFMYQMFRGSDYTANGVGTGAAVQDPRWRYYFYRQVGSISPQKNGFDPKALGCTPGVPPPHYIASNTPMFCVFEPGFYGRDHGDGFGTPPDAPVITAAGVYPAGGRPDNNSTSNALYSTATTRGDGKNGGGIVPIYMANFTDFAVAEVLLRAGNTATAKTRLATAITNSIQSVKTFADGTTNTAQSVTLAPWTSVAWTPGPTVSPCTGATTSDPFKACTFNNYVNVYKTAVGLAFSAAATPMDVVGMEYYKATWGNGLEAYNLYRRTGAPRNMQPTLQTGPGPWIRAMVYPSVFSNLNNNGITKDPNVVNKVFWDGNAETLN